jgi:hypothetical protein
LFVYCLHVIWHMRPFRIRCPECRKIVLSNTPWVCGFCKEPNSNAVEHSLLDKCAHCGNEPKSYRCHHCEGLIFFSDDRDVINYAFCINAPKEGASAAALTRRLHMAELEEKVKMIENRVQGPKIKSHGEQLIEKCKTEYDARTAVRKWCREMKAQAEQNLSGDDLDDELESIKEIERKYC